MQELGYFGKVQTKRFVGALVTPGFDDILKSQSHPACHKGLESVFISSSPLRRGGTQALMEQVTQKVLLGALQTVQQHF